MNVRFCYLYRDSSNYKRWGTVTFADPDVSPDGLPELAQVLRKMLMSDGMFSANQVNVPELFLAADENFSFDDHSLHEFYGVEFTDAPPDDKLQRTFAQFLRCMSAASKSGWQGFHLPAHHLPRSYFRFCDGRNQ